MSAAPIERMKKILALARRGVDGEKATAEAMLARLMHKYRLTIADLEDPAAERTKHWFKCRNKRERALLSQITAFVLQSREFDIWSAKTLPGERAVSLTPLEFAEVDVRYEAYKVALKAELQKAEARIYSAFIQANNLGLSPLEDADHPSPPMDPEDLFAIMALMGGMKPVQVYRQIEDGAA
jgi:hypothetical protein